MAAGRDGVVVAEHRALVLRPAFSGYRAAALGGRRRRGVPARRALRHGDGAARPRPRRARGGQWPARQRLVLVPIPRRRRGECARPHAHGAGRECFDPAAAGWLARSAPGLDDLLLAEVTEVHRDGGEVSHRDGAAAHGSAGSRSGIRRASRSCSSAASAAIAASSSNRSSFTMVTNRRWTLTAAEISRNVVSG